MSALPLAEGWEARRAVQTVAVGKDGRSHFGSGYLVAADMVLTAAHVLHDAGSATVRFVDGPGRVREVEGAVAFEDVRADVAVLRLPAPEPATPPVTFGFPEGPVAFDAVGFPLFKLNDDHHAAEPRPDGTVEKRKFRDSHHAAGMCRPASNRYAGTLELTTATPPERHPDPKRSQWEGMSGSAVFVGGRLIAVVNEHHREEGAGTLTASKVQQWYQLLDPDQVARLHQLIGLPSDVAYLDSAAAGGPGDRNDHTYNPADTGYTGRPLVNGRRVFALACAAALTAGAFLPVHRHTSGTATVAGILMGAVAAMIIFGEIVDFLRRPDPDTAVTKLTHAVESEQRRFLERALTSHTTRIRAADQPFTDPAPDDLPEQAKGLLLQWQDVKGGDAGSLGEIAAFFEKRADRRLMVLGESGMGKSVLLAQLTLDLIAAGTPAGVVPAPLDLNGFAPIDGTAAEQHRHFVAWLVEALVQRYRLRPVDAHALVHTRRVLPVLDGLDEMDPSGKTEERQKKAAAVLVALNHERLRVVVACRRADAAELAHENDLSGLLHDARHVVLQPLTPQAVESYLLHRFPHDSDRWQAVLADVRRRRKLWEMLSVPLYLQLAVAVYTNPATDPADMIGMGRKELRDHLLAGFVPAVHTFGTSSHDPGGTPEHVTVWLGNLAVFQRALAEAGWAKEPDINVLSLGWMTRQRPIRVAGWALALGGFAAMIATSAILWHTRAGDGGLVSLSTVEAVLICVSTVGMALLTRRLGTLNRINLNALRAKAVRRRTLFLTCCGTLGAVQGVLLMRYLNGAIYGVPYLILMVVAGMLGLLIKDGLAVGATTASVSQLLRQSLCYSLLIGSLASAWLTAFSGAAMFPWLVNAIFWAAFTVMIGMTAGCGYGWLRFYVGTRSAARQGALPRRTAEFLDWGIEVGLLRTSGQELQFRHQDHRDWLLRTVDDER